MNNYNIKGRKIPVEKHVDRETGGKERGLEVQERQSALVVQDAHIL